MSDTSYAIKCFGSMICGDMADNSFVSRTGKVLTTLWLWDSSMIDYAISVTSARWTLTPRSSIVYSKIAVSDKTSGGSSSSDVADRGRSADTVYQHGGTRKSDGRMQAESYCSRNHTIVLRRSRARNIGSLMHIVARYRSWATSANLHGPDLQNIAR